MDAHATLCSLTCNYLVSPLGLEDPAPRLSWQLSSSLHSVNQSAYRVLVASSPDLLESDTGDLWDSGRVISAQSVQVPYAGKPLSSRLRCSWKVKVWFNQDQETAWSEPAFFEMGLLSPADWQASWIAHPEASDASPRPAPFMRKTFTLEKTVKLARIYICGLGYHELHFNGQKVGDHVLDPAFTRYDRRALYVVHDVTALLQPGENAFGVILGNGLFNQAARDAWYFEKAAWRAAPCLCFQAHLDYEDGTQTVLTSGADWKVHSGPILFDATRLGERYNARLEMPGWDLPGFDDSAWQPARVVEGPRGKLTAQLVPVKVIQEIQPVSSREVQPGIFVFDTGQNMAGWARLHCSGAAGTQVTLRYGEKLGVDGRVDLSELNMHVYEEGFQTDGYILNGSGDETYEPRFTYHGFRYVEVAAPPGSLQIHGLEACVVQSAFEQSSSFECSNDLLNRIQHCTVWSYRSNFVGYPTDCPQREKNGWTGDAHIGAETGLYNFNPPAAYWKWLDDLQDEQREDGALPGIVPTSGWGYEWGNGPCWDSAYLLIPWYLYLYRGDRAILERHYAGMKRYVDYVTGRSPSGLVGFGLGDWVPPFGNPEDFTAPLAIFTTAYYFLDALVLARSAAILGMAEDAQAYQELADKIKAAYNQRYYDPESGLYASGSQAAQATALGAGFVQPGENAKVLAGLLADVRRYKYRQNTGIHSAKFLYNALAGHGRFEDAYRLACQTAFPSLGFMVEHGATTLWENWDGYTSQNHIMFGDISAWFFRYIAGILPDPEQPGFKRTLIQPHLAPGLDWARGSIGTPYGPLAVAWTREPGHFHLQVAIPPNTSAQVTLPSGKADEISAGGLPWQRSGWIRLVRKTRGSATFEIGSGDTNFDCPLPIHSK